MQKMIGLDQDTIADSFKIEHKKLSFDIIRSDQSMHDFMCWNIGRMNVCRMYCIYCGRKDAPAIKGDFYGFHANCLRIQAGYSCDEGNVDLNEINRRIEQEFVFETVEQYELMLELATMEMSVSFFDFMTFNQHVKTRIKNNINGLANFDWLEQPLREEFDYVEDDISSLLDNINGVTRDDGAEQHIKDVVAETKRRFC